MIDCGDAFGICEMLYPHALNEEIRSYASKPFAEAEREFVWVLTPFLDFLVEQPKIKETFTQKEKVEKTLKTRRDDRSLYLMKDEHLGKYKIGVSNNPEHRERTLSAQKPSIKLVGQWKGLASNEKLWHQHFKEQRVRGEWFNLTKAQVRFLVLKSQKGEGPPIMETA